MSIKNLFAFTSIFFACILSSCGSQPVLITSEENIEESALVQTSEDNSSEDIDDINSSGSNMSGNRIIYVHISGAVNTPGVYEMDEGSRLYEVVNKAGGFTADAAEDYCNLAMILEDGMQYIIPTVSEAKEMKATDSSVSTDSHYDKQGRLNINLATKEELMQLPGIGETRATAILEYRDSEGCFADIEDVKSVPGIKNAVFSQIEMAITVK